jgi:tape measure domain-containing protein
MGEKVSFSVYLKDFLSSGLAKLARVGNSTFGKLKTNQDTFQSETKQSSGLVSRLITKLKTLGSSGTGGIDGVTNSLFSLKRLMLGFVGISLFTNVLAWGADMEQTRISFQTLLQDVEKGNVLFEQINQFANLTPFDNRGLQANARTLLSFNIAGTKVMGTLKMLGDVAGGNKDRMRALTLAYAQSQAAGKLMGQDLLQFINAGFNPLQIISQKTGKTLMDLREEMQKGAISSEMIAWAFKTATSEGGMFYNMMVRQSQTIAGKWSTVIGSLQFKLGSFVESNNIVFISILDGLMNTVNWVSQNGNVLVTFFGVLASGFALYKIWVLWNKRVALWQAIVAATNPFILIVIGLAALAAGLVWAWNKFEGFRKVILGTWEVIKGFGNIIKTYVTDRIAEMLRGISGVGTAISLLFQGKFKEAAQAGSKALGNIFIGHESKSNAIKAGMALGDAYKKGAARAASKSSKKSSSAFSFDNPLAEGGNSSESAIKTGSILGGIGGKGSGATRNVTITINNLVEKLEVHTTNISESLEDIESKVSEILLQAVNDANLATG